MAHHNDPNRRLDGSEVVQLSGHSGVWLAVGASVSLVVFFYGSAALALVGALSVCITGFFALAWALDPLLSLATASSSSSSSAFSSSSSASMSSPFVMRSVANGGLVTGGASVLVIFAWFVCQHWILNNALGVAMCVLFVSLVRVPSMKVSAAVLGSLFLYDIFWVFLSHHFFGENVMLAVATREAQNPAAVLAQHLHLEAHVSPSLQLPAKIIFGPLMLGLGDIVLPGLLAAFAMRFGHRKTGRTFINPHYLCFLCGYGVGLLASFAAVMTYRMAQPALLYIVPSTLGALALLGLWRGELVELWHGFPEDFLLLAGNNDGDTRRPDEPDRYDV